MTANRFAVQASGMIVALLNQSAHFDKNRHALLAMARAIGYQLRHHAAPAWGTAPWQCVYCATTDDVPEGASRLWVIDSPDVADALGYHDVDPEGHTYGKVFVEPILDAGGSDTSGDNSVSVTASHEALEIFGDPPATYWVQRPDGVLVATELCDPVEAQSYTVTTYGRPVDVSNFVTPGWFRREDGTQKFDYLGSLREPFSKADGGYLILMKGGRVYQEFGRHYPEWRKAMKAHPAARTARRAALRLADPAP